MEFMSPEFWSALLSIILIDLVLAGDNAIVIGMAARNVPKEMQKRTILLGTFGAIAVRVVATVAVVWLLQIPGLLVVGGALLLWVAYSMLVEEKDPEEEIEAKSEFWAAVRTIVVADALMGLDNVLAVAGAAHGSILLVVIGLLISVPIIIWGSTLFIHLINRFPIIIYIGAGVIAFTAGKMLTGEESLLYPYLKDTPLLKWSIIIAGVLLVLTGGRLRKNQKKRRKEQKKKKSLAENER